MTEWRRVVSQLSGKPVRHGAVLVLAYFAVASIAVAGPALQVNPDRIFFPDLGHGERPRQTLTLFNGGDETLRISSIKPSCDCIKVFPATVSQIAPGESVDLEVTMHSGRQMGKVNKKLRIKSNDATKSELSVPVGMSVFPQFTSRPSMRSLEFSAARGKAPSYASIDIIHREGQPKSDFTLAVDSIKGRFNSKGDKFLSASIKSIADGKRITVELDPQHPAGRINAELTARLNGKKLIIPINGEMQEWIFLEPSRLDLNQADARNPRSMERQIKLTSIDGTAFAIESIRFEPNKSSRDRITFTFDKKSTPDRKEHTITVRPAAGKIERNKRNFFGKILVTTNHPQKGTITVNYFGLFKR